MNLFVRQAQIESDQQDSHETAKMRARAEELRKQFEAIDIGKTGMISESELAAALKKLNFNV